MEQSYISLNINLDVIRNKIRFSSEHDITFRPLTPIIDRISHEMEKKPTKILYNRVREYICGSSDIKLWNGNSTGQTKDGIYFVGFHTYLYRQNCYNILKNSTVSYPIQVTLLDFSDKFR